MGREGAKFLNLGLTSNIVSQMRSISLPTFLYHTNNRFGGHPSIFNRTVGSNALKFIIFHSVYSEQTNWRRFNFRKIKIVDMEFMAVVKATRVNNTIHRIWVGKHLMLCILLHLKVHRSFQRNIFHAECHPTFTHWI